MSKPVSKSTFASIVGKIDDVLAPPKAVPDVPVEVAPVALVPSSPAQVLTPEEKRDVYQGGGAGLAGMIAGAYLVEKHRVLGAVGGAAIGMNLPALVRNPKDKQALSNLGTEAIAIAASLLFKSPFLQVGAFEVGAVVGGLAMSQATGVVPFSSAEVTLRKFIGK